MKYAVDRIESDIVVLENICNGEKMKVSVEKFNFRLKEKDIVLLNGTNFVLDNITKEERLKIIREKMNKLKAQK